MLQQIFTIFDSKAGAYLPPFFMPQRGMALRTFGDCINDEKHQFSLHPGDYTLMSLGTFDDTTARAIITAPESIGNGLEFIDNGLEFMDMVENPNQEELELVDSLLSDERNSIDSKVSTKKGNSA